MIPYDDYLAKARADAERSGRWHRNLKPEPDTFLTAWVVGGMSGGTPWERATPISAPEPEPELDELLELLDDLGVRLRHVNEIKGELRHDSASEQVGYYGNRDELRYKYITVEALGEKLAELGYVEPKPPGNAPR